MKRLNLSPAKFHGKDWHYAINRTSRERRKRPVIYYGSLSPPLFSEVDDQLRAIPNSPRRAFWPS